MAVIHSHCRITLVSKILDLFFSYIMFFVCRLRSFCPFVIFFPPLFQRFVFVFHCCFFKSSKFCMSLITSRSVDTILFSCRFYLTSCSFNSTITFSNARNVLFYSLHHLRLLLEVDDISVVV